ncbi:class I SAM-dependent methyltransferase [Leptospira santarosai]|uniref:class I SAM-dependent methyltransferase n=1 Tax=Leptospira santarosai TaxID=28183 RepID=UPI000297D733|nr:class I SAM-dependent methyltransferase [Leptospira santarosai]EKS09579.1 methyltransferase, UbiE/COQ5 family [Leptospira santarosai str. JET]EMF88995.1 methyltransferase, UbiE/COQ5 family [Leptospira santarosai str. ST188]EMO71025.1 methyltransferase, UbiE/COQ5 family [Leptospira santarosai str. 200403458]EMO99982.1 methyltransferase, UbiE/COQ5 family [Leptospira santarosai str. 200702252]
MKDEDRTRFQKRFFDRFANSYYFLNILTFGLANLTRRRSLTALKIGEGEMICDLMCGDGSNIGILRRRFQHNRIVGLDISERMIERARKRFGENNVTYLTEDALSTTISSDSCDAVSCTFGIKTLSNEQRKILFSEVYRILKPSGTFVFTELSRPSSWLSFWIWNLYFGIVLPILGRIFVIPFVGKKYLSQSIDTFGSIVREESNFRSQFSHVNLFSWYGGIVTGAYGKK